MFVDSDDWIDIKTCELAIEAAQETHADLVFWSYTREFKNISQDKFLPWKDREIFNKERLQKELHRRQCGLLGEELKYPETADSLVTAWGKLYSAEKLKLSRAKFVSTNKIGTEDALFNLYALGAFTKAIYIKQPLYHYRKTNNMSLTSNYRSKFVTQWNCLFDSMQYYIDQNGLSSDYSQALQNRISLSIVGLGLNTLAAPCSELEKIKMVKEILSAPRYRRAIGTLKLRYFPAHWKVFYLLARWNCAVGVYLMLQAIRKLISRG